jgi:hypothetical protein
LLFETNVDIDDRLMLDNGRDYLDAGRQHPQPGVILRAYQYRWLLRGLIRLIFSLQSET